MISKFQTPWRKSRGFILEKNKNHVSDANVDVYYREIKASKENVLIFSQGSLCSTLKSREEDA
jgi:hypothetical protein